MTVDELKASLAADAPPAGLSGPLAALWHAGKGAWHRAHEIVQDDTSAEAARVHAYLHRLEGDHSNAAYWDRQAGEPAPEGSHEDEWNVVAGALLTNL